MNRKLKGAKTLCVFFPPPLPVLLCLAGSEDVKREGAHEVSRGSSLRWTPRNFASCSTFSPLLKTPAGLKSLQICVLALGCLVWRVCGENCWLGRILQINVLSDKSKRKHAEVWSWFWCVCGFLSWWLFNVSGFCSGICKNKQANKTPHGCGVLAYLELEGTHKDRVQLLLWCVLKLCKGLSCSSSG